MARPKKEGVDYFSLDVDFFEDDKVRLLRAEFGAKGMYILVYLLCEIYAKNGYYMSWNESKCLLVSDGAGCGCNPGFVQEFINGCFKRSFFDKGVFDMFGILTSRGIQRRYLYAVMTRKQIRLIKEYCLLNSEDFDELSDGINAKIIFKSINLKETPANLKETGVNFKEMPQSKVKQSKGKESKEESMSSDDDAFALRYQDVMDLFNQICQSLPKAKELTDKRKRQMKTIFQRFKPDFKEVFERVEKSDFLTGRNGKWNGCSFDWILNPSNFVKVIEGNYDNKEEHHADNQRNPDEQAPKDGRYGTYL